MSWVVKYAYIPLPKIALREGESSQDFEIRRRETQNKARERITDRTARWKMSRQSPAYVAVGFWNAAPLEEKNQMIETRDVVPLRERIVEYLAGNELPEGFNENVDQEILKLIDESAGSRKQGEQDTNWVKAAGPARDRAIEQGKAIGAEPKDFVALEGEIQYWIDQKKSPAEFLATIESFVTGDKDLAGIMEKYPKELTWDGAKDNVLALIEQEGWTPGYIRKALGHDPVRHDPTEPRMAKATITKTAAECPRCALGDFTRTKRPDGVKHKATTPVPDVEQLEEWSGGGGCEATDGCWVEPDGHCEHGHSSWMLVMGVI
jgi:hypothetical protein